MAGQDEAAVRAEIWWQRDEKVWKNYGIISFFMLSLKVNILRWGNIGAADFFKIFITVNLQ